MTSAVKHIPSLDGIRAISFLIVFVAHMGFEKFVPGGLGVTIFFFLSGYLITTLLRIEYERLGRINLKHFWLRRVWRILPPFYIVLISATALALAFDPPGQLTGGALAAQYLHFTNYWMIFNGHEGQPPGTGVYWSLAVEEHFYLLFPWLYIAMQRWNLSARQQGWMLYGLCLATLLWRFILVCVLDASTDRTYMASDTRLDSILFGCALAVWGNPILDPEPLSSRQRLAFLLPVSLVVLLACLLIRDNVFRETLRYSLQGLALAGLFTVAIRDWQSPLFRWLNTRPLVSIGTLSYTLYLMHFSVLIWVERGLPDAPALVHAGVSISLLLFLAWLLHHFVEKPCAQIRRRLTD